MAGEPITSEMLQEAGIAAHLAADPDALPAEISELSDQAAIFASQSINAFMLRGAADADSAATNFGTSLATKAVERMIELEAERRKEDDPASDASMIAEAGARQRDAIAEMQSVTYSNGQFHMFGMDIDEEDMDAVVDETLENIDEVAARHGLDAQQTAQLSTWLMAYRNAETPEQKAEILGQIADEHPEIAREMGKSALQRQGQRAQNEMTHEESQDSNILSMADGEARQEVAETVLDETESYDVAVMAESNLTIGENPFADTRSPNSEFNARAAGDVQFAQAAPTQSAPVISGPGLAQG
jgi:hypothetical protein